MKKKMGWIVLAAVLVILIGGASVLYDRFGSQVETERLVTENTEKAEVTDGQEAASDTSQEEAPVMAPDFTVYDAEGNAVKLSDFIGKPTVVNFWASWCGPCQMEMPDFDEKYAELGEKVNFLMVNLTDGAQETKETASKFIEKSGYSFPVYFDTDKDAAITYGVNAVPATYFIDAEGHAVAVAQGMIDGETLQYGIEMISE